MTILAFAVAASLSSRSPTIRAVHDVNAIGQERRSCASWVAAKRRGGLPRKYDEQWFWGFVTGVDMAGWRSDEQKLVWPSDTPADFLVSFDAYCSRHPSAHVQAAAAALYRDLFRKRR